MSCDTQVAMQFLSRLLFRVGPQESVREPTSKHCVQLFHTYSETRKFVVGLSQNFWSPKYSVDVPPHKIFGFNG